MEMKRQFLDRYRSEQTIKPRTEEHYATVIAAFETWLGRSMRPEDWCRDTLNHYLMDESERLSLFTVKSRRTSLRVIWRALRRFKMVTSTPCRLRAIKTPDLVIHTWEPDEVAKLIQVARTVPGYLPGRSRKRRIPWSIMWEAWWRVQYDTGLRMGDQFMLEAEDVLVNEGRLTIVQEKTGRASTVKMRPETIEAVRALHSIHRGRYVFPQLWKERNFCKAVKRFMARVGMTGTTTKMRKSSGTEVDRLVKGAGYLHLGHARPDTARKWYVNAARAHDDLPLPPLPDA